MAQVDTANNPNDPNNPNAPQTAGGPNQLAANQQTNQPATSGGAGAVTSTGAGNVTGQVVGTANPAQPFQNIASYLAANAPQSAQLAQQVAGTVSQPITQAQNDITNAANTFTGSVTSGYTPENSQLIQAVAANPAGVVAENPQNVTNFASNLNDTYTGPTDFTQSTGFSNLESEIANANATAANASTPTGVQTLLQGVEGPTTQGINNLDSLLLNQNPTNAATIAAAGAPAANLTPTLNATTAAEDALAAQGGTNASTTAADAAAALQAALTGETTNLGNEQNTIQGIVNEYNQSVNTVDPVMANIASALQTFLQQNPNINVNDPATLTALENLTPISMPSEATYASPQDYATIAALAQLGENPATLAGLPITSATANEAQTFNVPTQLQNALGQAPAVEQGIQGELNTIGGDINTAVSGFEAAQTQSNTSRNDFQAITGNVNIYNGITPANYPTLTDPTTGAKVPATISQTVPGPKGPVTTKVTNPAWTALQQQAEGFSQSAQAGDAAMQADAPGLQWVNSADTNYQNLVNTINSDLGQLGSVGAPTLTYGPNTVTDPVTGIPIGTEAATDVGKIANTAAAGATGAAGIGAGIAEAGSAGEAIGEPLAAGLGPGASINAGLQAAGETLGPAALAAYGASNIAQNTAKNPVQSGLMTLANTGLSLATLSLPPQIFQSIGKDITNVLNDIGSFFGGLF